MVDTGKVKIEVRRYLEFMVKHSKKLILRISRREMEKRVNNYLLKVTDLPVPQNELKEIGKSEDLMILSGKIYDNIPSEHVDVQWTSIERPYRTCGRPKGTFNGRLVDVPNETQLVCPDWTKMDVYFRPSRDAMHSTWTSSVSAPDVH